MPATLLGRASALSAIERLLAADAQGRTGLLVVESAPWCGAGALLRAAAAKADAHGLSLAVGLGDDAAAQDLARAASDGGPSAVCVLRPGAAARRPALAAVAAAATEQVAIGPLSAADARMLARSRDSRLPPDELASLAGGRPGLIAALAGETAETAPARLERILRGALAQEGEAAIATFEALAVLDSAGPVGWGAVAAVTDLSHAALADAIDALLGLGLLVPGADGPPAARAAWPQAAAAVLTALPGGRRAALHHRAATALADAGHPAGIVAAHAAQALPSGDQRIVEALRRGARLLRDNGDAPAAAAMLERALAEPVDAAARGPVLAEWAAALTSAADPGGDAAWGAAIAALEDDPIACAEAWAARGRLQMLDGRPNAARGSFESGLALVDDPESMLARELQAALSSAVAFGLSEMRVAELDARLRTVGPLTPAERSLCAQVALVGSLAGEIDSTRAHELARAALDDGRLLAEEGIEGPHFTLVTGALLFVGAMHESIEVSTAGIADAQRRGSALGVTLGHYVRSAPLLELGRLDECEADARAALTVLGGTRGVWRSGCERSLAQVAVLRDRPQLALELADRLVEDTRDLEAIFAMALGTRADVLLAAGDPEGAIAAAREAGAMVAGTNDNPGTLAAWRSTTCRALTALGRPREGVELAEAELELARAYGAAGPIATALISLGLALGHAERRALSALEEAEAVLDGTEWVVGRCGAQLELGAALRRAGRRTQARRPLAEALDVAHRLGLTRFGRRAEEELRATGARPRRRELQGLASLTPSERRVVEAVARGRSNPDVAAELFVSRKTVEYHLGNAFRKLGVTSREALAELVRTNDHPPTGGS